MEIEGEQKGKEEEREDRDTLGVQYTLREWFL